MNKTNNGFHVLSFIQRIERLIYNYCYTIFNIAQQFKGYPLCHPSTPLFAQKLISQILMVFFQQKKEKSAPEQFSDGVGSSSSDVASGEGRTATLQKNIFPVWPQEHLKYVFFILNIKIGHIKIIAIGFFYSQKPDGLCLSKNMF